MNCSICNKRAEAAYSITHSKCGHTTHADCFVEDQHDFNHCEACLNPTPDAVEGIESPAGGAGGGFNKRTNKIPEPRLKDGHDYVNNPGTRSISWKVVSAVAGSVVSLVSRKPAAPVRKTPTELLREKMPMEDIFRYGYGLDHMLSEGVTIDDFIASRYKWGDLCAFEDVSAEGPRRALDAFVNGLKLTANHLKNYPDLLPFDKFKELTKLETSELCTRLGMEFPVDACLQCDGKTDWNAKDCTRLGLTIDDLRGFGLYCQEQYVELMEGLSAAEQRKAERDLGVTPELFGTLRSLKSEQRDREEAQRNLVRQQQSRYVEKEMEPPQEEQEEQEEEEEEKEDIKPVRGRAMAEKPFVYEHRFKARPAQLPSQDDTKTKARTNKMAYLGYTSKKK